MTPRFPVALLTLLLVAATLGCDGKPCSEKPEYAEYDEKVVDEIEDLLDDGDVHDRQKERVVALHAQMAPVRDEMRRKREGIRTRMIDELVAVEPDPKRFHALIDAMYDVIMPYAYLGVEMMLRAHRMLTAEQRGGIAETLAEPPDPYDGDWKVNRGIDAALFKIDATDEQKALVLGWRDKMVAATDKLLRDQHAQRMILLEEWLAPSPDRKRVRKHVDIAAKQISRFVHTFGDAAMEVTLALTPQQRMWTNQQVNKLRRCEE